MSTTTSSTYRVGETYRVAPRALTIGANVRTDTQPGASEFAASIKARGVLEPITVWVDDDGNLVVYRGQRRTLAAASEEERPALEAKLAAEHEKIAGGLERARKLGVVDEVITPTTTRVAIARAVAEAIPARGAHGNIPL